MNNNFILPDSLLSRAPLEVEPNLVRRFESHKHWRLRGWWRGRTGSLLAGYLALHESSWPQLRDCELGPLLSPKVNARSGDVRSLSARRLRVRALVLHEEEVVLYEGSDSVRPSGLERLNQLARLVPKTRDLQPIGPRGIRKVMLARNCSFTLWQRLSGSAFERLPNTYRCAKWTRICQGDGPRALIVRIRPDRAQRRSVAVNSY